jgi:autotransporter-associated beta strand protein
MNALSIRNRRIILSAGIATLFVPSLHAALDLQKANNTDPLNVGTSWVGGVVPTATDVALWDSTVTGANTVSLGGDLSFLGIKIANPGGAVTINAGNTLTLGTAGIDMTTATQDFTINSGLGLGGAQTWDFGTSGRRLNAGGIVSGGTTATSILTITGTGTALLSGANTFTGRATIGTGALVNLGNNAALGAAGAGNETLVNGGTLNIGGSNLGTEAVSIQGTGVGGIGALINQGASQQNALQFLTLTGNATVNAGGALPASFNAGGTSTAGALGRFDIRTGAFTAGAKNLDLAGNTLTKTGGAILSLVNADVTTGNLVVNEGTLNIEAGTVLNGAGTITVNPDGKLAFFSLANAGANANWAITLNGGTVGDAVGSGTGAAQTIIAPISITGATNPNFSGVAAAGTTLSGVISKAAGSTVTEAGKRGGGLLLFSNPANSFDVPVNVYQGTLRANFTTALPAGGVPPAAALTTTDTPLGTNQTIRLSGGVLSLRINMDNNNTQQRWDLGRDIVIDRAPSTMDLDRLSNASQTDKHVVIRSLTFAPASAANGFSIGQNQLTFNQGNTHRLEIPSMTMNDDSVLTTGDFTLSGDVFSANRNSLVHTGGNTIQFINSGTQQFNAFFHVGSASLRVGSGFGTPTTSSTVTVGNGPIYIAPNNAASFRTPTNLAPGQTVEIVSQRVTQSTANFEQFTSVPANLRALGSGVLGVGNATNFGDIDLNKIGDGTFRIGAGGAGSGTGVITGVLSPGADNIVRMGAQGTVTLSGDNRIAPGAVLEVGSPLINGGFATITNNAAQNGTVLLTGDNDYSGGTIVNRSSTLRFQGNSLGSGPITIAGTATAESAGANGPHGTFIGAGPVTMVGGGSIRFVNDAITAGTTPTPDRWGDSTPLGMVASTVEMRSRNIGASDTIESIGPVTFAGGNTINLQRLQAVTGHNVQLTVDSLTRVGQGAIELARSTGTGAGYGAGQKLIVTNGAPTPVNGMVSPWIAAQNNGPTDFVTYGASGFVPITYDQTVTTGTYTAGALDYNGTTGGKIAVTTAALALQDNPVMYALRTDQSVNINGANNAITLRGGGLNAANNTGTVTIAPTVTFNDGAANIEGVINTRSGGTLALTGVVTAGSLTKFGAGTLNLSAANVIPGNVAVDQGTLQSFGPTATGTLNTTGTGQIELAGGNLNLRSNNSAVTGTINQTLQTGVTVAAGIPIATIDVNRSGADTASSGTFIFNRAAAGQGLQLLGAPGVQGQTLTVSGANYALQFGSNAQNSFAGNVTINNAVTVTLNAGPTITGTNPIITKSGTGTLIVGAAAGSPAAAPGTQAVVNAGTLELRSITALGTSGSTSLVLNGGTLNLRRDSAGNYGNSPGYPVIVNGNTTISTDRVGGSATNYAEGLGQLSLNGNPVVTFNSGNGIYPDFLAQTGGAPTVKLNGLPIIVSNVGPGGVDSAVRFSGPVAGGGLLKLGGGHLHLVGANSTYDGGTFINQGVVRARAANALGTGPVVVSPGSVIDFNATNNLGATQPLIVRGNSSFLPMISVNTDIPHPTANVDATGAPVGIIGLSNGTGGTYNTPINMAALYGGNWSLGGISTGAYDGRYTAATLGAGAGNTYRLGGGGLAIVLGVDNTNAARTNLLTGPNNVVFGFDSGNIRSANTTTFQVVVGGTNDFTGSSIIQRGTVARLAANNDGTRSGLSNGAVNVFGNLVLGSNASFAAGATNTNAVTLHPGSALHFDNNNGGGTGTASLAPANVTDRWADSAPISLNGGLIDLIGNNNNPSAETVGDVTYSRGARLRVARTGTGTATLTMNNLNGAGPGNTLTLQASGAGLLGTATGDRIIVANAPPASTNGMVTPSIINATDNTFVTHGVDGFANVTYDKTVNATYAAGSLLPTDKVDVVTAALNLSDNPTVYALRTSQSINVAGPNSTLTIRSGGLIATGGTIAPNLVFNDGNANVEARIYNSATVNINGTITANGITKFGNGNLTINVPQSQYASGWTVNSNTLQINDLEGLGQSVPGNAVTLNATQTTGGSVAQAFGQTNLTFNRNTGSPELAVFTGGPITVVNEATIRVAGGDDRNLQIPNVTLMSTGGSSVGFTFDVPNNRYRGTIPTLTLMNDATVRVFDSGSTGDTGRVTTGAVGSLVGTNTLLTKIGNRTLELSGNNAATFVGGGITVAQGTVRVLHNGSLGSATSTTTVERNATLEIAASNFVPVANVQQLPGSIERWDVEDARGAGTYNLPAGVNLQLNTNLIAPRTIGLNGGTIEGFLWIDHPAPATQRNIASGVTINLLSDSLVGQNILQGQGYDAGRQPTTSGPFGDNITGAFLRIDGNITGGFNLTKTGLDTVVLAGTANTYNNTIVDSGVLRIGADNALPTGRTLTTRYAGTFDLYGQNQTVGGLGTANAGPDPGAVGLGNSGSITNSGVTDNTLTVNNNADHTYNGTIERNVALTKSGTGKLTLTAANTYTGATTIESGTLEVTGSINGTATIDVRAGGTLDVTLAAGGFIVGPEQVLKGGGNVTGPVTIQGTLAPGDSPGTLTLTGPAAFSPGSTFDLEINSDTAYDQLSANGVTLDGPVTLNITLGYTPAFGTIYTVLNNTSGAPIGGSPGLFTSSGPEGLLTQGERFNVNGQDFLISYQGGTGNDVLLQAVPEPSTGLAVLGGLATLAGLQRVRRTRRSA